MAFDNNLVSKDLRPVNVARPLLDDSRIGVVGGAAAGTVMSPEFFTAAPEGTVPVFYPAADSGGFVGVGYRNVAPAAVAAQWVPVPAAAAGNVNIGVTAPAAVGYGYYPNSLGSRVVGNAVDQASAEMLVGGFGSNPRANPNSNNDLLSSGYGGGGGVDHTSEDGGDDSMSGKKIKLLCSFGGRILPRPSDGALRYVGGQTRIISVRRETTFGELMQKMVDTYGQPVVMKYQLPEEDLDALVSVSCPEDLDNMLDEYEKLVERSSDGSGKLRVFLFSGTEVDASGMVQLGDMQDNGQRYVDAVNGIVVDNGGGGMISGKESTASASSTQNSDVSGAEGADIPGFGQGEVCGTPSASGLSPRGNSVTSQDAAPRLLSVDPNPRLYADMPSVSLGIPLVKSGSPPALVSHHEVDFERSAAPMNMSQQQMGYEQLPQTGMPVQSNAPHLPAYRDYLHAAPQMGYPNAQRLTPAGGSLFAQQPIHDANASLSPHHYMPGVHMTMAPSSSLAPMRPTMVQPMMQAQPTRMDHYPDEKMYGTRIMQVPVDPSYNMYQAQVPQPAIIGGGYSWRQVPQPEHVVYSDGMIRHQQVHYPEKASRPDDCLMCQKALPHAHSDPVVHEQSPLSLDSMYHSLRMEESSKVRPLNRVMVAGATGEATVAAPSEAMDLAQCAEAFHEAEKISPRMMGAPPEQPKMSAPLGMMGIQGDAQSTYGLLMGTMPQSRADDTLLQQHAVAAPRLAGGGLAVQASEGMIYESPRAPYVGNLPLPVQASEGMICESPRAPYVGNLPHVVSKENIIDSFVPNDQLKPIEGNKSAIDQKIQQGVPSRELLLDSNYLKQELQPAADFSYLHSSQPIEPYDVAQSLYSGDPGAHLHSMVGGVLDSGDVSCVNPQYVVEPVHQADRVPPPVSESKSNSDISKLLPSSLASEVESLSLGGNPPSSASSSSRLAAGMQESSDSLFSNQDPWNLRHDTHFPPPKPLKIATRKDNFGAGDPFKQNNIGNVAESVPDVLLDDGISQTLRGSEPTLSSKGSEDRLIKQELQAVAEGVAASVLKSSTQSTDLTDLTGHERNESPPEASEQPKEAAPVKDVEAQHKAKAEDLKNKQPEKVNVGFPKSEGAGRLQIIKSGDLEELFELGSGTFGTVYHGKWRGTDVAIKRINDRCFAGKPSEQERMIDDFWNEAIKLADLHHPNVVAFYGVVLDGPGGSVATVTEYMVNGSLRTALQKNERCLDKRKRLLIAMDVAFGMEYLHGKNIVHFDLKSDNLLVNLRDPHRPICKVGDLGLSKVKCQTLISGGVRGTLPWMAPELLNGSSSLVSEKVDVFSFGIVLWELLTGEEPYADLHYGAIIGGIVSNTLRPLVPDSCDPEWKSLMERCWSAEPVERPSFTEIASDLRAMAAKIPSRGQTPAQQGSSSAQPQPQK